MLRIGARALTDLRRVFGEGLLRLADGGGAHTTRDFIDGDWATTAEHESVPDPLTGAEMLRSSLHTTAAQRRRIVDSLAQCPKSGLHNPFKRPERYRLWGDVCLRLAMLLHEPPVEQLMLRLQGRAMPKSAEETFKEFLVTRRFVENFAGDSARFALRGFCVAGDRPGNASYGLRFPFGPVALVTPFNFPVEIVGLQLLGALMAGNKVLLKPDARAGAVAEALLCLLLEAGMPCEAALLVHNRGAETEQLLRDAAATLRCTLFTGSHAVARRLSVLLEGRVRLEDAGLNWKLLGPDVRAEEFVAAQIDQDSYACSGQKCSAQRLLFVHANWARTALLERVRARAASRSYAAQTLSPVLSWSNERLAAHLARLLRVPGARLLWGGAPVAEPTAIPARYGSFAPTAVRVPLEAFADAEAFAALTTEVFGPLLVVADYADAQLEAVLGVFERISFHLTAGVVSSDLAFINRVLGSTVNGVTYAGVRARTTGAPQNHWFGPGNDPRAAGIGTPESIVSAWTCHREVVFDVGELGAPLEPPPVS